MRRSGFYAFIFLILGHPGEGFAQARRILPGEKRSLSDSLIRKTVEGDDAFRYDSGPLLQTPGWWERFWSWVWSIFRAGTSGPVAGRIWEYIF
ncbi:MAG: hypothetical protein INR69_12520, partial [Mucilaginibacter polytrichastri]|nr:hypothetical protein [Mucilaginibacter polytrichastri]